MASETNPRSFDDIYNLCVGVRPGIPSADVAGGPGQEGAALKLAKSMEAYGYEHIQECLPSQCGAPEAWHYAQALAALGSRVLSEMHRAGSVGQMVTGDLAGAATELGLAEWKDGRFHVRSTVHGDKRPDPMDYSQAVVDAGMEPDQVYCPHCGMAPCSI